MQFSYKLLQETHSATSIEHIWRNKWPGNSIWSHGSSSSKKLEVLLNHAFKGWLINHEIHKNRRFYLVKLQSTTLSFLWQIFIILIKTITVFRKNFLYNLLLSPQKI